jgi:microcystin-dependent protein
MTDLAGPASNTVNVTTVDPGDSRVFGASDTYFKDCTPGNNDGTGLPASWFNGLTKLVRGAIRGMGITVDNTNFNMLLQAIQAAAVPYGVDTGAANALVVDVNKPGFSLAAGTSIRVKVANTVTGAATIDVKNAGVDLGTYNITRTDASALNPYDLVTGQISALTFDGTEFQIARQAVDGSTGEIRWRLAGSVLTGYLPLNGLTIGDGSSAATGRASADTVALYTFLWNNFSDTLCPVTGGRGGSAAGDYAAHKPIRLPNWQCRVPVMADAVGGAAATNLLNTGVPFSAGNAATPGSLGGEATHTLLTAELPAHNHAITDPGHSHTVAATLVAAGSTGAVGGAGEQYTNAPGTGGSTTGITINNTGGGGVHNNEPLFVTAVAFARL